MNKRKVAVCDTEDSYRVRFVTYLIQRKPGEFAIHGFSDPKLFLEALEQSKIDLAVIGRGFEGVMEILCERQIPVLLLQDTLQQYPEDSAVSLGEQPERISAVYRYQPIEVILHEMQVLLGAGSSKMGKENVFLSGLEVIGVCSPIRHEMQIPFSYTYAALLSEKKKILYVNYMEYSGFPEAFGLSSGHDMGDIVLRLRNHRLQPEMFLRSVYEEERIFYIPPFHNPESLHELNPDDISAFLEFLRDKTDFETVLIDFGNGLTGLGSMLEYCTGIYCLVKSGFYFESQTHQFLEYLQKSAAEEVTERIQLLNVPFSAKGIHGGDDIKRQLLWSEFGDYVRGYLTGEAYGEV